MIEQFFEKAPSFYAVASGTFLLDGCPERDFPYFFFEPSVVKETLRAILDGFDIVIS